MRSKEPVFVYDARLVQRHLNEGKIRENELSSYLQDLPDCSYNVDVLEPCVATEKKKITGAS